MQTFVVVRTDHDGRITSACAHSMKSTDAILSVVDFIHGISAKHSHFIVFSGDGKRLKEFK